MRNKLILFTALAAALFACKKPDRLDLSEQELSFTDEGGSKEVGVECTNNWSATVEGNWIKLIPAGGTPDKKTFTVTCDKNDTYKERSATIYVRSQSFYKEIKVTQNQNDGVIIKGSSYYLTADQQSFEVLVGTNVDITVVSDVQWLKDATTKALDYKLRTVSVDANTGNIRQGILSFTKPDGTVEGTITVIQDGVWPVVPPAFELEKGSCTQSFTLDVPFEYTVKLDSEAYWIKADASAPNTFKIEENGTGDFRETKILLTPVAESSSAKPYTLKVMQLSDPYWLEITHGAGKVQAPLFNADWMTATIDWGDGQTEPWAEGLVHDFNSEGTIRIEVNGVVTDVVIPSMKNIHSLDISRF